MFFQILNKKGSYKNCQYFSIFIPQLSTQFQTMYRFLKEYLRKIVTLSQNWTHIYQELHIMYIYVYINDKPLDIKYIHYTICVRSSTSIHFYMYTQ